MTNAAGKTLNTQNALYSNIVSALSASALEIRFTDLFTGTQTLPQSVALTYSNEIPLVAAWAAVQGVCRNSTHWFGINTVSLSRYNLDGSGQIGNNSPFSGLPAGLNHCGDSFVDEQYLYVPIANYVPVTQTGPTKVIAWYNVSDLSLAGYFDISSTDERMNASGLTLSPNGAEFWLTSYRTDDVNDEFTNSIWRYSKTTGAFLGRHVLSERVLGMQGIAYNPSTNCIYISSWRQPIGARPRIYIYDNNYQLKQITRPVGVQDNGDANNEMEGICHWDGDIYFHTITRRPRLLSKNTFIAKTESKANFPQFVAAVPESGTILIRCKVPVNANSITSIFDNKQNGNTWESWHNNSNVLNWRINSSQPGCTITGFTASDDERLLSFGWERSGTSVTIKLGVNGVWGSTVTQTWVTPPSEGLWLGGVNAANQNTDMLFNDVLVFNKSLTDVELLESHNNFNSFYDDGAGSTEQITTSGGIVSTLAGGAASTQIINEQVLSASGIAAAVVAGIASATIVNEQVNPSGGIASAVASGSASSSAINEQALSSSGIAAAIAGATASTQVVNEQTSEQIVSSGGIADSIGYASASTQFISEQIINTGGMAQAFASGELSSLVINRTSGPLAPERMSATHLTPLITAQYVKTNITAQRV